MRNWGKFLATTAAFAALVLAAGCGAPLDNPNGNNGGSAVSEFASISGSSFTAGAPPAPTGTAGSPKIDGVEAPTDMINGGSGLFTVTYSAPVLSPAAAESRLPASAVMTRLIVVVQGDAGYFSLPLTGSASAGSRAFTMVTYSSLDADLVIGFAVIDSAGNVSDYVSRAVRIHQTGTGDIKISLSWDQPEDLDLRVIDPFGEEIYWDHPASASGGRLDLDSNGACIIDNVDNENIFWGAGAAPSGIYKVRVKYEMHCSKPETNYTVTIIAGGEIRTYPGSFTALQEGDLRVVAEFSY